MFAYIGCKGAAFGHRKVLAERSFVLPIFEEHQPAGVFAIDVDVARYAPGLGTRAAAMFKARGKQGAIVVLSGMDRCGSWLSPFQKRCGDILGHPQHPSTRTVNDRPCGFRAYLQFAVFAGEGDMPIKARPARPLGINPCPRRDPRALINIAEIIDLVPKDDPEIGIDMLSVGGRHPVRGRHILNPSYPDGIIDMPQLVDVAGLGDYDFFELGRVTRHCERRKCASQ